MSRKWYYIILLIATVCIITFLLVDVYRKNKKNADYETETINETSDIETSIVGHSYTEEIQYEDNDLIAPEKEEVIAMRNYVLEGVTEEEKDRLCTIIKEANHNMEALIIYDNLLIRLKSSNDLYWNYIDKSGDIQIGWAYDGNGSSIDEIMNKENLTKEEFYEKYGREVMGYNKYSAVDLVQSVTEIRESIFNESLRYDLKNLIEELQLATETHEVVHVERAYHILHDMDYYLLNYRTDIESTYIRDESTIRKYYGALSIYTVQ